MVNASEYFFDFHFLDIIVLCLLLVVWFFIYKVPPKRLFIPRNDSRCSYPHYESGITEKQNLLISIIIPCIFYAIFYILTKFTELKIQSFDFIAIVLSHGYVIVIANIFSCVLKVQVGRPRPDFYHVLGQDATHESNCPENIKRREFYDEFKSFPSGHSTTACSAVTYFMYFINYTINTKQIFVFGILFLLFLYPLMIAATRITYHRHHPSDVTMGLFIGFSVSTVLFLCYKNTIFTDEPFP